jgi:hypothetical protein
LIFGQSPPVFSSLFCAFTPRANFLLSVPLHTPTSPVDLKFRGHAQIFWRDGCVPLPRAGIVGKRNGNEFPPEGTL